MYYNPTTKQFLPKLAKLRVRRVQNGNEKRLGTVEFDVAFVTALSEDKTIKTTMTLERSEDKKASITFSITSHRVQAGDREPVRSNTSVDEEDEHADPNSSVASNLSRASSRLSRSNTNSTYGKFDDEDDVEEVYEEEFLDQDMKVNSPESKQKSGQTNGVSPPSSPYMNMQLLSPPSQTNERKNTMHNCYCIDISDRFRDAHVCHMHVLVLVLCHSSLSVYRSHLLHLHPLPAFQILSHPNITDPFPPRYLTHVDCAEQWV